MWRLRVMIIWAFIFEVSLGFAGTGYGLSPLSRVQIAPRVEVAGDDVYLGDLIVPGSVPDDWSRKLQTIYVGKAPNPGEIKYVQVTLLEDYLRKIITSAMVDGGKSDKVAFYIPKEVIVSRKTVVIPEEEIDRLYRDYIHSHSPWNSEDITIDIDRIRYAGLPMVPAGKRTYEVTADTNEQFSGNVTLSVRCIVDGKPFRTLRVAGFVRLYRRVLHAKDIISQGSLIEPKKLSWERVDITDRPDDYATAPVQIVGKRTLKDFYPGEPIRLSDVDDPIVLKKGDVVKIVFQKPGLMLTTKGVAKEDGHIGDTVRVMNLTSKKIIHCRVKNNDIVVTD